MNIFYKLYSRFAVRFLKKKVVYNFRKHCRNKIGQALLYYKTDPFFFSELIKEYSHTNNWEILEMVKILNKLGFWVDIIDRTVDIHKLNLKDKYDIFLGDGAGDSGRYYPDITQHIKKAVKILYATSQEPAILNEALQKRYEYFFKRHPDIKLPEVGFRTKVDMQRVIQNTDFIFCIGNGYSINTYKDYKKPIYRIYPSTSSKMEFNLKNLINRSQKKFLYFGGNRNILKGLDLLIEIFVKLPNLELYICTPAKEKEFNLFYKDILSKAKNIHWLGFVQVGGDIFNKITSECGYIILPSCSEGTATSVVTCMRKGLIPIVTPETGIDIEDFGYLIKNIQIDSLKVRIQAISKEPRKVFIKRSIKSYLDSFNYTQAKFSESFEKALIDVLVKNQI